MTKNIAIIGAGITGLTAAFYLKKAGIPVTIFEKNDRVGGVMQSFSQDGFVFEQGPNSGVLSNIEMVNLLDDLKDDLELEIGQPAAKKRLIWQNGHWEALPSGLWSALKTPLFTWKDKFRILGEPFRSKGTKPDETVAAMVKRRLGSSFLDYAIDPFISGIYAGNPDYLVTQYALPKLYQLEQDYGSFIKGAFKKAKIPKTADDKRITKEIFSIKGGLNNLPKALAEKIGKKQIVLNQKELTVRRENGQFKINNQSFTHVINTVRADYLSGLYPFLKPEELTNITNLQYAPVVEIGIGYHHWKGADINAFGGLVPMVEHKNILGLLFMSTLFPGRAPHNGAIFTLFIGGSKKPELTELSESKLLDIVKKDFIEMMQLSDFKPDMIHIKHYKKAIAQYGADSRERLEAINRIESSYKGLILAGSIRDGVGIADRVKQAKTIADKLSRS